MLWQDRSTLKTWYDLASSRRTWKVFAWGVFTWRGGVKISDIELFHITLWIMTSPSQQPTPFLYIRTGSFPRQRIVFLRLALFPNVFPSDKTLRLRLLADLQAKRSQELRAIVPLAISPLVRFVKLVESWCQKP